MIMLKNWDQIKTEALTHFQNLLRINTTNPPGNEAEAIAYLAQVLKKEEIEFKILEAKPGRANLIACLPGNGKKKPMRNIMLQPHDYSNFV